MTTLTTLDSQLDVLFGPGNRNAQQPGTDDAKRIAILEARAEQLARQHEAFRQERERILIKSLEERDARINEQRTYLERLEREVAERTQELREKTERLERANDRMKRDLEAAARDICEVRAAPGFPIGWLEEADWEEHSVSLEAGDRLYLYSDGVTEATNENEEQFGSPRLCSLVEGAKRLPLQESVTLLLDTVIKWSDGKADDDVSVLAIEMTPDKD